MRVSVVIPSLHSPLIADVVAALQQQTLLPDEIIIVGQDRYGLIPVHPSINFIETAHPISAAAARNQGARYAQGDLLLFIDSDCIAASDLIEQTVNQHIKGTMVASGGVAFETHSYWNLCDNLVALTPFLAFQPASNLPYLPSLNLSIRRELFWEVDGFDERFPGAAGEDTDLSFKLRKRGYQLDFIPHAQVLHRHNRIGLGAVWHHLARFGSTWGELQRIHTDLTGSSVRIQMLSIAKSWAVVLAVFLSLLDSFLMYIQQPTLLRYWYTMPGIFWSKLAWHYGLILYINHR
jgi:glycosyltransferase involved in cell wall biosynthesis